MKTIGLIGGMSWQSSQLYYGYINEKVKELKGSNHSAKCILNSVDFAEISKLQSDNNWSDLDKLMIHAALQLERAGADIILIGANTMHLCYEAIVKNTNTPCLHIAETTGNLITNECISKVALVGTKFTMEKDFYKNILSKKYGVEVIVPNKEDRDTIHQVIYDELISGVIREQSKIQYIKIMNKLVEIGAKGIILGCTEIPLLVSDKDVNVPLFNTTQIHAEQAVQWACR